MSSKKKAQKEKDEGKPIKCQAFVLESDSAVLVRSNDYPLASDAINIHCGRPYGALDPLDWTAARAWLDEVPPASTLKTVLEYASQNRRRAKDNSLPPCRLEGAGEGEILRFSRDHWTRRQLQREWQSDIVDRLGSATLYPRHSVNFTYSAGDDYCGSESISPSALHLGAVIRRLIHAHCEWCNHHRLRTNTAHSAAAAAPADAAKAYRPDRDYQKILGHSIRCTGFVTSMRESKEVAFNYTPTAEEALEFPASRVGSGRRLLSLTSHYNSTYINVCCGKTFYILPVLDTERRRIKSLVSISSALDAIYENACEREEALEQLNVSAEVRQDLREFYGLLARMTATADIVDADIHRRLCEVSEVNANNLEMLEGALFTVVLDGPLRPGERRHEAQWLHSMLSLYYQWDKPRHFRTTCYAAVSAETFQGFLKRAMTEPMTSNPTLMRNELMRGVADQLSPQSNRADSPDAKAKESSIPSLYEGRQAMQSPPCSNPCAERPFQTVELWLPQKHRTALRPYPPVSPAPKWREVWFNESHPPAGCDDASVAQFCVAAVLAVERILFGGKAMESKARRPSVVFAFHHSQCTTPSVVSLLTKQMEEYIQALRSPSVLLNAAVQRAAAERAVQSIGRRLQDCVDTPMALYGMSQSAFMWEGEDTLDVCVTFGLLSQQFQKGSGRFAVQSVCSELCLPSRLHINGTAAQVFAQKHPILGDGNVRQAELGVSEGNEALADTFTAAFLTELAAICEGRAGCYRVNAYKARYRVECKVGVMRHGMATERRHVGGEPPSNHSS
eukprot:gene8385-5873_t